MELTPSQKEAVQCQFDAFCKKVIRNEARNYMKHIAWQSKHEVSLSELSEEQSNHIYILPMHGVGIKNTSIAPICLLDYFCNVIATNSSQKSLDRMKNIEELLKGQSALGS